MIYDQDPEARAKSLHDALTPIAEKLRERGADVEFITNGSRTQQRLIMMVTLRCPFREAVVVLAQLERIAITGGGAIHGDPLSLAGTSGPEGVYYVALGFSVAKKRAA